MARWKEGDRIKFDVGGGELEFGTIRTVSEPLLPDRDVLYSVRWDDGFDDEEGNVFAEWELIDPYE